MFRKQPPEGITTTAPVPDRIRLALCALAVGDAMTVAWMLSAGDWLDRSSSVTAVVTLGGHHLVVIGLAAGGFAVLLGLAALTRALTGVRRAHVPFLLLGAAASAVALSGVASVALVVAGAVLLITIAGFALFGGGRLVFLNGFLRRR